MKQQMTLGKLIEELCSFQPDALIQEIVDSNSYRGNYYDLALEIGEGTQTVDNLLDFLEDTCLRKELLGYKGGLFYMTEDTPVWIAGYGDTGSMLISLGQVNGVIYFITEYIHNEY